ncbi:copper amine oxidase N-terminal domain-containing protein [Paenibacillus glycinis]|uniref:Copper amine oxidase-like N-terminal domain-containing protein n=1 Tax=Paenibacillus glycinis TaxID=2697035 RepID=A0ABW9XNG6_9BACL|nr:copper amine oxidase N-terminal domain-containing protein [Paenibacillus glycinis]NBD24175.1 hypothetical protein [Paenibacillus glycinis]
MKTKKLILPAVLGLSLLPPAIANADSAPTPSATAYAETMPSDSLTLCTIKLKVNDPMLSYNGSVSAMDTTPMLWRGNVYVPVRALGEGVGAKVSWDAASGATVVWAGDDAMKIWLGREAMDVNGASIALGSKVIMNDDGRVMVPLRVLAKQLGWDVDYSTLDWSVTLTKMMSQ